MRLQSMKTGRLITAACEMGAILGKAAPSERAAVRTYGEHLGTAFQISDDLLDAEGTTTDVGKATGKDAAAGKATLVGLLGIEAARDHLDRSLRLPSRRFAFGDKSRAPCRRRAADGPSRQLARGEIGGSLARSAPGLELVVQAGANRLKVVVDVDRLPPPESVSSPKPR